MNLGKIIVGLILLALIPTHWFLAGLTVTALGGGAGLFIVALWLVLFVAALSLIIGGLMESNEKVIVKKE
jgi:hypothetical protein